MVPGCLTGESEERETWTAESLRAALPREFRLRKKSGFQREGGRIETSAVDVSGNTMGRRVSNHSTDQSGTSSNVVTCREKVLNPT